MQSAKYSNSLSPKMEELKQALSGGDFTKFTQIMESEKALIDSSIEKSGIENILAVAQMFDKNKKPPEAATWYLKAYAKLIETQDNESKELDFTALNPASAAVTPVSADLSPVTATLKPIDNNLKEDLLKNIIRLSGDLTPEKIKSIIPLPDLSQYAENFSKKQRNTFAKNLATLRSLEQADTSGTQEVKTQTHDEAKSQLTQAPKLGKKQARLMFDLFFQVAAHLVDPALPSQNMKFADIFFLFAREISSQQQLEISPEQAALFKATHEWYTTPNLYAIQFNEGVDFEMSYVLAMVDEAKKGSLIAKNIVSLLLENAGESESHLFALIAASPASLWPQPVYTKANEQCLKNKGMVDAQRAYYGIGRKKNRLEAIQLLEQINLTQLSFNQQLLRYKLLWNAYYYVYLNAQDDAVRKAMYSHCLENYDRFLFLIKDKEDFREPFYNDYFPLFQMLDEAKEDKHKLEILARILKFLELKQNYNYDHDVSRILIKSLKKSTSIQQNIHCFQQFILTLKNIHAQDLKGERCFEWLSELKELANQQRNPQMQFFVVKALAECYTRSSFEMTNNRVLFQKAIQNYELAMQIGAQCGERIQPEAYYSLLRRYIAMIQTDQPDEAVVYYRKMSEIGDLSATISIAEICSQDETRLADTIKYYEKAYQMAVLESKDQQANMGQLLTSLTKLTQKMNLSIFPQYQKTITSMVDALQLKVKQGENSVLAVEAVAAAQSSKLSSSHSQHNGVAVPAIAAPIASVAHNVQYQSMYPTLTPGPSVPVATAIPVVKQPVVKTNSVAQSNGMALPKTGSLGVSPVPVLEAKRATPKVISAEHLRKDTTKLDALERELKDCKDLTKLYAAYAENSELGFEVSCHFIETKIRAVFQEMIDIVKRGAIKEYENQKKAHEFLRNFQGSTLTHLKNSDLLNIHRQMFEQLEKFAGENPKIVDDCSGYSLAHFLNWFYYTLMFASQYHPSLSKECLNNHTVAKFNELNKKLLNKNGFHYYEEHKKAVLELDLKNDFLNRKQLVFYRQMDLCWQKQKIFKTPFSVENMREQFARDNDLPSVNELFKKYTQKSFFDNMFDIEHIRRPLYLAAKVVLLANNKKSAAAIYDTTEQEIERMADEARKFINFWGNKKANAVENSKEKTEYRLFARWIQGVFRNIVPGDEITDPDAFLFEVVQIEEQRAKDERLQHHLEVAMKQGVGASDDWIKEKQLKAKDQHQHKYAAFQAVAVGDAKQVGKPQATIATLPTPANVNIPAPQAINVPAATIVNLPAKLNLARGAQLPSAPPLSPVARAYPNLAEEDALQLPAHPREYPVLAADNTSQLPAHPRGYPVLAADNTSQLPAHPREYPVLAADTVLQLPAHPREYPVLAAAGALQVSAHPRQYPVLGDVVASAVETQTNAPRVQQTVPSPQKIEVVDKRLAVADANTMNADQLAEFEPGHTPEEVTAETSPLLDSAASIQGQPAHRDSTLAIVRELKSANVESDVSQSSQPLLQANRLQAEIAELTGSEEDHDLDFSAVDPSKQIELQPIASFASREIAADTQQKSKQVKAESARPGTKTAVVL